MRNSRPSKPTRLIGLIGPFALLLVVAAWPQIGSGQQTVPFDNGIPVAPHGLTVDRDGNVWVVDCACTSTGRGRGGGAAMPAGPRKRLGKSLDQIKESRPALPYETRYGSNSGPWTTNAFIEAIYKSLTAKK